ncbi:MAG: hypothetical protein QXF45_07605 [Candidatus Caldarchaeum sp.]
MPRPICLIMLIIIELVIPLPIHAQDYVDFRITDQAGRGLPYVILVLKV